MAPTMGCRHVGAAAVAGSVVGPPTSVLPRSQVSSSSPAAGMHLEGAEWLLKHTCRQQHPGGAGRSGAATLTCWAAQQQRSGGSQAAGKKPPQQQQQQQSGRPQQRPSRGAAKPSGPVTWEDVDDIRAARKKAERAASAAAAAASIKGKASSSAAAAAAAAAAVEKDAHKLFDEVVITVRSGNGGDGEVVPAGKGRTVPNFKYKPGGNLPKKIWLPASEPADGADGADVLLVCDPAVDDLLHLHVRKSWAGKNGSNGNPQVGSGGPKKNQDIKKSSTQPLRIPVPPGTVVKRRGTGTLLGELLVPGQELLVAQGGLGGSGVVAPSRDQRLRREYSQQRAAEKKGVEVVEVEDDNWRADSQGKPGHQLTLQLLLRVVADVGIVGFPNAGKSSLLAALTRASPDIAPYPFTTLMPNLGVLTPSTPDGGGVPRDDGWGPSDDGGSGATAAPGPVGRMVNAPAPVLADLPGLIEGAHKGRGLGRMFLRHLRRARVLMHVVDASAEDPVADYTAVREELRMYNPSYCSRPHVVALNKVDAVLTAHEDEAAMAGGSSAGAAEAAEARVQQISDRLLLSARAQLEAHGTQQHEGQPPTLPAAVIKCSAVTRQGLDHLQQAIAAALAGAPMPSSESGSGNRTLANGSSSSSYRNAGHKSEGAAATAAAAAGAAVLAGAAGALSRQQQQHSWEEAGEELEDDEEEEQGWEVAGDEGGTSADAEEGEGADMAPSDDEDAWLLNLTDEELLALEAETEAALEGKDEGAGEEAASSATPGSVRGGEAGPGEKGQAAATGAAGSAGESGSASPPTGTRVATEDGEGWLEMAPADDDDLWLLDLDDEQLLAMIKDDEA